MKKGQLLVTYDDVLKFYKDTPRTKKPSEDSLNVFSHVKDHHGAEKVPVYA